MGMLIHGSGRRSIRLVLCFVQKAYVFFFQKSARPFNHFGKCLPIDETAQETLAKANV